MCVCVCVYLSVSKRGRERERGREGERHGHTRKHTQGFHCTLFLVPQVSIFFGVVRQSLHQFHRRVGQVEDFGEAPAVLDRSRDIQSLRQRLSLSPGKGQIAFFLRSLLVCILDSPETYRLTGSDVCFYAVSSISLGNPPSLRCCR